MPTNGTPLSMARFCRSVAGQRHYVVFLHRSATFFGPADAHQIAVVYGGRCRLLERVNNSLTRYLEELELTRERVGLVLEAEDRRLNVRMSRIMYRFGVLTGIFYPSPLLPDYSVSMWGSVPFSNDPYGFAVTCLVMLVIGVGQWWFYRRLQWL